MLIDQKYKKGGAMFKSSIKDKAREADNNLMLGGISKKKKPIVVSTNFSAKLRSIYKTEANYLLAKKVFTPAIKRLRAKVRLRINYSKGEV